MRLDREWFDTFGWQNLHDARVILEACKGRTLTDICKVAIFIEREEKEDKLANYFENTGLPTESLISREPGILILKFGDLNIGLVEERVRAAIYVKADINNALLSEMLGADIIYSTERFCATHDPDFIEASNRHFIGNEVASMYILKLKPPFPRAEDEPRFGGLEIQFKN